MFVSYFGILAFAGLAAVVAIVTLVVVFGFLKPRPSDIKRMKK